MKPELMPFGLLGMGLYQVTWSKGGVIRRSLLSIIQTTLYPRPDLAMLPIASQNKEDQELLRRGYQAYSPSVLHTRSPPGVAKDHLLRSHRVS